MAEAQVMSRKPTKKAASNELVDRMDSVAGELLTGTEGKNVTLETRLAIFAQVAKWVHIRNRLSDGEEGNLLNDYRTVLDGATSALAARESGARRGPSRPPVHVPRPSDRDLGGPELEALKSRIPRPDDGDRRSDRQSGSGKVVVDAGPMRIIRADLPGNSGADDDEARDNHEL